MILTIVKSDKALDDLAGIWEYIAFSNPVSGDAEAADRVIQATDKTFTALAEFPHRREIPGKNLFLAPIEDFPQYLVLYQFDEQSLEVLRVFRSDRDWMRLI